MLQEKLLSFLVKVSKSISQKKTVKTKIRANMGLDKFPFRVSDHCRMVLSPSVRQMGLQIIEEFGLSTFGLTGPPTQIETTMRARNGFHECISDEYLTAYLAHTQPLYPNVKVPSTQDKHQVS